MAAYDPRMMVQLLIYGCCRGVASGRLILSRFSGGITGKRDKLATAEGQSVLKMHKAVVGPVFGQIKERRGFRRFLLCGLASVEAEWKMICATPTLLKPFRSGWRPQSA
jgi:hypothetical protein